MNTTRAQRRQLERDNAKQPGRLQEIPRDQWPANAPPTIMRVFRSRDFLVQEYELVDEGHAERIEDRPWEVRLL